MGEDNGGGEGSGEQGCVIEPFSLCLDFFLWDKMRKGEGWAEDGRRCAEWVHGRTRGFMHG